MEKTKEKELKIVFQPLGEERERESRLLSALEILIKEDDIIEQNYGN